MERKIPRSEVLSECARFEHRYKRVTSSPFTLLTSPINNVYIEGFSPEGFGITHCPRVHYLRVFYQLNHLTLEFRRERSRKLIRQTLVDRMPSSCKDIRAALAQCLQESDCVMIDRNKPSDCLRSPLLETMPLKCQQLKKGYGECKRGMVDMRKRFRGNQSLSVGKDVEEKGGQLYGGKPAFGSVVKKTDGEEPIERDWRDLENEKFRRDSGS